MKAASKYSLPIRILHLLLAIGIVLQTILGLTMWTPKPGRTLTVAQATTFEVHEIIGIVLLVVLSLHWFLFLTGHAYRGIGHFFPWFSRQRRQELRSEFQAITRLDFTEADQNGAVAAAIQGLGLVCASLLALSGTVIFFGMAVDGSMSSLVHTVKEFHQVLGPVLWGYLIVHAGGAMLHAYFPAQRSVLSIFRLKS